MTIKTLYETKTYLLHYCMTEKKKLKFNIFDHNFFLYFNRKLIGSIPKPESFG